MKVRRINGGVEVDDGGWFAHTVSGRNCSTFCRRPSKATLSGDTWWTPDVGELTVYDAAMTHYLGKVDLASYSNTDPVSTVSAALSARHTAISGFFSAGQFQDFSWVDF